MIVYDLTHRNDVLGTKKCRSAAKFSLTATKLSQFLIKQKAVASNIIPRQIDKLEKNIIVCYSR